MYTKLDRAGSGGDNQPAVHDLFIDLPFSVASREQGKNLLAVLCAATHQCHRYSVRKAFPEAWRAWNRQPKRASVSLVKGGPGQGKSTIGQYLCQIQRAYLILDTDGPTVNNKISDVAKAIRAKAMADEFWPTTGRIPIQIELKEFAHWYSQRTNEHATGVLSYIAWLVGKNCEAVIQAKTIKNALAKRSWLVVFDGLDEVPNDHKDQVAKQVLHFLNDVLIENDADVLAVCTSRPQGYSGQFSALEGPVLDLVQLDTELALSCAAPLLRFGRSPSEAEKSIQILQAAMASPSIQELMTTPLQSHIMAMVVRDGGHPPERRWRLFQSFYNVMKRRESLKDFKDGRVARLLREEDRLLKGVHMRLGFVLHARAERSSGAQTMLSKAEFRDLVEFVVKDLGDDNVEETVAVVMEATTERLVLVSTPDNGDQVRFDIRQLQEYFAAEYLYDGLTPEQLGKRIQVIGADAHWREVMHFLMSALIADRRTAELAVSVMELQKINGGDEASGNQLYARRTAPAAFLAGRLLLEGVLEEDQNDRRNVKPLFDALGGVSDLPSLRVLLSIRPAKSRKWMVDQFLERIEVASPADSIGALFLLGYIDSGTGVIAQRPLDIFFKAPIAIQEKLLKYWGANDVMFSDEDVQILWRDELSAWVVVVAIRILNSDDWGNYHASTIAILQEMCRINNFSVIWEECGLAADAGRGIADCFAFEIARGFANAERKFDCGLVDATVFAQNWQNGANPPQLVAANRHIEKLGGAFRLMFACLRFAQERSVLTLNEAVRLLDLAKCEHIAELPDYLLALIPVENWQSDKPYNTEHLRNIGSEIKISKLLNSFEKTIIPPYSGDIYHKMANGKGSHWRKFVDKLPIRAIGYVFEKSNWSGKYEVMFIPELVSILKAKPAETAKYILAWGYLVAVQPELLDEIKAAVCRFASQTAIEIPYYHRRIEPFEISLTKEIRLLDVFAPALLALWLHENPLEIVARLNKFSTITALLKAYGLTPKQLRDVAESTANPKPSRAAALALYWASVGELDSEAPAPFKIELNIEQKLYVELVDDFNLIWFTKALTSGLLLIYAETDPAALAFVTLLLNRCSDGRISDEINELLSTWRERSNAPVHTANVLGEWLGYSHNPPSYAINLP